MPRELRFFFQTVYGVALLVFVTAVSRAEVDFARDIRPILSDRCFKCHGFDEEGRKAGLGLHTLESAMRDGAIVPGSPEESLIMERILSDDPDEVMPPPSANKPTLSPEEAEMFRKWIATGAEYEEHWAFVSPRKNLKDPPASASGNPVDGFIGEKLEEKDFAFAPEADPHTLARRLYLDLIGLTPTPGEVSNFIDQHKSSPDDAVASLVDELMERPEYGERWARLWLDLARYADTNGYEKDRPRSIWPYRDWVINALNDDMPYDQFTIEQLAGDMLPDATLDQKIATGFHRNTMLNEEGGIDPLEFRYHAMVDRVATTGVVWMGLTTGCAQCHTHKFDPITHEDYFSMFALLNNADEPEIEAPTPEIEAKRSELIDEMTRLEAKLIDEIDPAAFDQWKSAELAKTAPWQSLRPVSIVSTLPRLSIMEDDSVFASGDFNKRDVYDLSFELTGVENPVTAIRIEALPDERLPAGGPGAAYYEGRKGDFFLSEVEAKGDGKALEFLSASVDFGKIYIGGGKVEGANVFDGNGSSGWSTATREGERHELVIRLKEPLSAERLDLKMIFERHFVAALGRFRISVTTVERDVLARGGEISDLTKATDEELQRQYVRTAPALKESRKAIEQLKKKIPSVPTTLVMREWEGDTRPTFRHHRGDYLQPKEEVSPRVPEIFEGIPADQPANRLSFARWLVSESNPLAARVAVNRAWRAFFGRGLVHTAGDFGYQSELPSHPELLDYLAIRFIDEGWSVKKLHRLIATSQTYRQDATITPRLLAEDPKNIYLARGPRFRLDGEVIRDAALRSSGLLTQKVGGPSVYPPQPASVSEAAYGKPKWKPSGGGERFRRSLYTFAKRTAPFAAYLSFDGPTGESCLARRERSNTPLQALTLLNDPMFTEAAVAIGIEVSDLAASDAANQLFRRILTRPPSQTEIDRLVEFYYSQLSRIGSGELDVNQILDGKNSTNISAAAWSMVARALYNLDEAVTKG